MFVSDPSAPEEEDQAKIILKGMHLVYKQAREKTGESDYISSKFPNIVIDKVYRELYFRRLWRLLALR